MVFRPFFAISLTLVALFYLPVQAQRRRMKAADWFCRMPAGTRVAIALLTLLARTAITRTPIW